MKSYLHLLLLGIVCGILFTACQKDLDQIEPIPSETYLTHLFGIVMDHAGEPIVGAEVAFRDEVVYTDEEGSFLLRDAVVDARYNHINIQKEGFFMNTRTFRGSESKTLFLRADMIPQHFDHTIPANIPSGLDIGTVRIDFKGGGMIFQNSSERYHGDVLVSVQYIDPLDANTGNVMPGDLSAVDEEGRLRVLESFGMLGVELRSLDGEKLQLAPGNKAIISARIPQELRQIAPDEIPLWHFDHDLGLWVEEGTAYRDSDQYIGEVSHFSFWNFDVARESVVIRGRIQDQNGVGLANMQIKIVREGERRGGTGYTDYDGYFSGPIERGAPLTLVISSPCSPDDIIFKDVIGPIYEETDLGILGMSISGMEYLSLEANFVDCNDDVLDNGLLKIHDEGRASLFPITDGKVDKVFGFCNMKAVDLEVINRDDFLSVHLGSFEVPGSAHLGVQRVCQDEVDHASIHSSTFDINLVMVDSVSFTPIGKNKSILAYDFAYELAVLEVKYVDSDEGGIQLGEHEILKMVCNWRPDSSSEKVVLQLENGKINIEEVDEGQRKVRGTYYFDAIVTGSSESHFFEGEFLSSF